MSAYAAPHGVDVHTMRAPMAASPNAKVVRLHFRCRGLPDMDTFSKSDPYVVLYSRPTNQGALPFIANQFQPRDRHRAGDNNNSSTTNQNAPYAGQQQQRARGNSRAAATRPSTVGSVTRYGREIGRTETIMNNLNPVFSQTIDMQFLFETRQDLAVVVYDYDGHTDDSKNDVCGGAEFQLSQIICSANGKKELPLSRGAGQQKGFVEISFTDMNANTRDSMRLTLTGAGLPSGGFCSGSSPYYTISRLFPNGSRRLVYTSETIRNTTAPSWRPTGNLPLHQLAGGSEEADTVLVEVFTASSFGGAACIGAFRTSIAGLVSSQQSTFHLPLRKLTPAGAIADPNSSKKYGSVSVDRCDISRFPTFTSSLAAGWQINMVLSIDFTGSNGDPRDTFSLHYMDRNKPNQYVSAMMSVGDILLEYDTDKMIPVYGFGANFPGRGTSHFFNVNQRPDPNVNGIQGALDAYGAFLPTVSLAGPTNFAPTIRQVTADARKGEADRIYTILLIITDGEITDMADSIDALVAADDAPLSIVIVGVGTQCDFQMMDELDGDDTNLRARSGRVSRRDLVQFVPYRDFAPPKPREALSAEVLREVPDQFEEYLVLREQRTDPRHGGL